MKNKIYLFLFVFLLKFFIKFFIFSLLLKLKIKIFPKEKNFKILISTLKSFSLLFLFKKEILHLK